MVTDFFRGTLLHVQGVRPLANDKAAFELVVPACQARSLCWEWDARGKQAK